MSSRKGYFRDFDQLNTLDSFSEFIVIVIQETRSRKALATPVVNNMNRTFWQVYTLQKDMPLALGHGAIGVKVLI